MASQKIADMPLTTYLIVAGIILYLYIRRANLGIDKHPGERVRAAPQRPAKVTIPFDWGGRPGPLEFPQGYPLIPPAGGLLNPGRQ